MSAQYVHDPFLQLTKSSILLYHACKVIVDAYFMKIAGFSLNLMQ